jgi:RHS repeat-associated protein
MNSIALRDFNYRVEYRDIHYDPALGRFLSADPIGFGGQDFNLYRYVENNPLRFIDPYGFKKFTVSASEALLNGQLATLNTQLSIEKRKLKGGDKSCSLKIRRLERQIQKLKEKIGFLKQATKALCNRAMLNIIAYNTCAANQLNIISIGDDF